MTVRGDYFTTEVSQLARSTMLLIPSGGLDGGRVFQDRLDSRKSRVVRSIAVFQVFLPEPQNLDSSPPSSGKNPANCRGKHETN